MAAIVGDETLRRALYEAAAARRQRAWRLDKRIIFVPRHLSTMRPLNPACQEGEKRGVKGEHLQQEQGNGAGPVRPLPLTPRPYLNQRPCYWEFNTSEGNN